MWKKKKKKKVVSNHLCVQRNLHVIWWIASSDASPWLSYIAGDVGGRFWNEWGIYGWGWGGGGGSISTSAVSTLFLNQSIMSPAVLQKCTARPADGFCGWIWLKKPSLDQVNHLKEIPELTRGLNSRCGLSCPKSPGWTSVYWCSRQGGYKCRAHSKDLSSSIMIYLDLCSDLWCKAQELYRVFFHL